MLQIHTTPEGCYHPDPGAPEPWVLRDARGFAVIGPSCERCGACECPPCPCHGEPVHERGCVGLSYAFVRVDTLTALCEACGGAQGIRVVACDCPAPPPEARAAADPVPARSRIPMPLRT
jgi:hypothetical protein